MIRCQKCGSTLAPHARFCSVCGEEVVPASPSNAGANATQAFDRTQGLSGQPNLSQTQNINRTQGFSRTAALQSGELQPTTAISMQNGYGPGTNPDAENKKRMAIMFGAGGALVLIAGLIFLSASGLLAAKRPTINNTGVLSAPPTQMVQAPVLVAPAPNAATAPVISAPVSQGTPMPADVIDYLRWLKEFEKGRVALEAKGETQLTLLIPAFISAEMDAASATEGDPTPKFDTKTIDSVIQDWNKATAIFQQKTPPNPCATLASNYNTALTTAVTTQTQLMGIMASAMAGAAKGEGKDSPDIQKALTALQEQKNTKDASHSVDALIGQANDALNALRDQYVNVPSDIDKGEFQIKEQSGGVALPSVPGLGI